MRTIIWFLYFWLYQLAIYPALRRVGKLIAAGELQQSDAIAHPLVRKWARRLLGCAGAEVTVVGADNIPQGAAVYVANHRGNFDIPTMLAYLGDYPPAIVAKIELQKLPLINRWMDALHCVFLDRDDARKAITTLHTATAHVKNGYNMVIFPEGTRSKTGKLGEFKSGAFRIAQKSGVPVVPCYISGTDAIMEKNGYWIRPGKITLTILPAIQTDKFTKEDWRTLPEQTQALLATMEA